MGVIMDNDVVKLWKIIDDIDTMLDMAKGDYEGFYKAVSEKVKERFTIYNPDI